MAAGDTIFACRSAAQGGALSGVVGAKLSPSTVHKVDQGAAGSPGPADALITDKGLAVELYGLDHGVLLGRIGVAAANLTIGTEGAAGADETLTITSVYFSEIIGPVEVPAKDGGGKLTVFGIRGHVHWGAGEGFGDVLSAA